MTEIDQMFLMRKGLLTVTNPQRHHQALHRPPAVQRDSSSFRLLSWFYGQLQSATSW